MAYFRANWRGTVLLLIATGVFFWPYLIRISSYSQGRDAMFNAWTLSRDHACILHQNCDRYENGNIFYPHADSMLYSETQLSTGLLTLPLAWIDDNPVFAYNVWTIASFFFCGWFMYLLAKYLSYGHEFVSVLAGAAFEFGPLRVESYSHLQNLSIFYLPLAVLLLFKYRDTARRFYLVFLFVALALLFYASWDQMVFALLALGILLTGLLVFRLADRRAVAALTIVVALAAASTFPLAVKYLAWSRSMGATFDVSSQVTYESSLADYLLPNSGTLLGRLYHHLRPHSPVDSSNPDSVSYHGMVLYAVALGLLISSFVRWRRHGDGRDLALIAALAAIGLAGFIVSLGPLLKIRSSVVYARGAGSLGFTVPLPWLLVDRYLPQLGFLRATGRASVLVLFALCSIVSLLPRQIEAYQWSRRARRAAYVVVAALWVFELCPVHLIPMSPANSSYNITIPPVYRYIKGSANIDDLIVLRSDTDYPDAWLPTALPEDVMWAGYDNKYTFNGYSGYAPPNYFHTLRRFDAFGPGVFQELGQLGLRYILVDKLLSTTDPTLRDRVAAVSGLPVYEDGRYALFRIGNVPATGRPRPS